MFVSISHECRRFLKTVKVALDTTLRGKQFHSRAARNMNRLAVAYVLMCCCCSLRPPARVLLVHNVRPTSLGEIPIRPWSTLKTLYITFQQSLTTGVFLVAWKTAIFRQIYEGKKDKELAFFFKPINICFTISKVLYRPTAQMFASSRFTMHCTDPVTCDQRSPTYK